MTDREINMAIAEACGWVVYTRPSSFGKFWVRRDESCKPLLDYCNDLNAMREAVDKLSYDDKKSFVDWICRILPNYPQHDIELIQSTARQRAEAFLRTLGKWKV